MIKGHIKAVRSLQKRVRELDDIVSTLPEDRLKFALEAELRILKRLADQYEEQSDELYEQILDFTMKVAIE